jgi:hypothetical protein
MHRVDFACMGSSFVRRRSLCGPALLVAALVSLATPAWSQPSRTDAVAEKQADKAKDLKPRVPPGAERAFKWVKDELIDEPSGLYPLFGSVYSGGGFTLGAGYRRYYGDNTHWDAKVLQSIRNYRLLEVSTDSWNHAGGRLDLHARAGRRDAPDVPFHGLGIDSPRDSVGFGLTQVYTGGEISYRALPNTHLQGGVLYEDYSVDERRDPAYWHTTASVGYDWRPAAGYARSGGLYQVRYHHYAGGVDDFARVEGEIVQHVPLARQNWVLSLRGQTDSILSDEALVPYHLLPSLGGGDTLRGFSSWRFRDRNAALTTAELRWIPNRNIVDVALFYDAGMVAPEFSDITLRRFKSDAGIGVRFHGPLATPLRIELAKSREGLHLVFAGSAAF